MSYGYTTRLGSLNKLADGSMLGVKLGRVCIRKEVPVAQVASQLGVSRQAVYNWFSGVHTPSKELTASIKQLIIEYKK
jgi:hypothetical protein|tara:strand:- start:642 stop:875 length:234 start_codon:yes stop_codon:yes gene_type:complete